MDPRPADRTELATWGLILAAMGGLFLHVRALGWLLVDDAAISAAYAVTFFGGDGFRVTPFSQVVEGFSNPLWTCLIGLSLPLDASPISFTQHLGVLLGVLALPAFASWGPSEDGRPPRLEDAAGVLLVAAVPTYAGWISSGMETGLQSLLLGLSGALILRELRTGKGSLSGAALGLLCLTRPEGPLYVAAAGAFWVVRRGLERQAPGLQELRIAAWLLGLVGGWTLFRWVYFADLIPNTYWAKDDWDFDVRAYFSGFGRAVMPVLQVSLLASAFSLRRGRTVLALLFAAAGCAFVWSAKGDWMGQWRFFAPLVPLVGVVLSAGLSTLRSWKKGWALAGAVVLAGLALRAGIHEQARREVVKQDPPFPYTFVLGLFQDVARDTRALGMERPLIAFPDLGGQAFALRNAEIIDLAGLADYALAHAPGRAAREDYLLSEGLPSFIDVHGPSAYLRAMPRFLSHYVWQRSTLFVLRGLTAEADPRCPGSKSEVLGLSVEALSAQLDALVPAEPEQALRLWRCAVTYRGASALPDREQRRAWAARADRRADEEPERLKALRYLSLATVLDDGDAWRRRKTEQLRAQLFSSPRTVKPPPVSR